MIGLGLVGTRWISRSYGVELGRLEFNKIP
jgi:hypothetical protein